MVDSNFGYALGSFLNRLGASTSSGNETALPSATTTSPATGTKPVPKRTKSTTPPPQYGSPNTTAGRLSQSVRAKGQPAKEPQQSDSTYSALSQQYMKAKELYGQSFLKHDTVDYSKSPKLKVQGGKDPGIEVPQQVLKDVVASAKKNGVDPYEALAQVSLESSFGTNTGAGFNKSDLSKSSLTDILQGWNLDEPYRPQSAEQFLEQKGVPGVKATKDKDQGYVYKVADEKKVDAYLAKHPEIAKAYQKHLQEKSAVPTDYSPYDAAFKRDKKGLKYYNPSPAYAKNVKKYADQFRQQADIKELVDGNG